jgi:hypothetical protein
MRSASIGRVAVYSTIVLFVAALSGCGSKSSTTGGGGSSSAKSLDGVYHGGMMTLTIKDKKATLDIGGDAKTLDYKVEGNKLTIINPKEGDVVFTINDDVTLNSQMGTLSKNANPA